MTLHEAALYPKVCPEYRVTYLLPLNTLFGRLVRRVRGNVGGCFLVNLHREAFENDIGPFADHDRWMEPRTETLREMVLVLVRGQYCRRDEVYTDRYVNRKVRGDV